MVVSPEEYAALNGDVVMLAMTSQPQADDELRLRDWKAAGLPKPSWFKPLLGTLALRVIDRRLGSLVNVDRSAAIRAIERLISSEFLPSELGKDLG